MKIIEVRDFSFRYANGSRESLSHVSLDVEEGTFNVLCGKSGCGKSTLLRQLKSDLAPFGSSSGKICYYGRDLKEVGHRQQSQEIGYVLQNPENQIVTDKVWHELAFGLESLGYDTPTIRLRVAEMASYFGIHQWFYKNVSELSGGQKQLLNLAAIMAMHPKLLILDEPLDGLDPVMRKQIWTILMSEVVERRTTVLVSSHNLRELEDVCDHVGIMHQGTIMIERSLSDLQGSVSKIQVACQNGVPKLPEEFEVLHMSNTGRVYTLIVKGDPEDAKKALASADPAIVDVLPLTLEEIFIYEMGGADYEVKDILL
jgi:energy-coupling factor transporter ATP-binding protein EcfA2